MEMNSKNIENFQNQVVELLDKETNQEKIEEFQHLMKSLGELLTMVSVSELKESYYVN